MTVFSVKPGVDVSRVHPECVRAWPIIMRVFASFGMDATITSVRDGQHRRGSLHYAEPNCAQDWRTWAPDGPPGRQVSAEVKADIARELRAALGPDFDVVEESTHIHIEFDPV